MILYASEMELLIIKTLLSILGILLTAIVGILINVSRTVNSIDKSTGIHGVEIANLKRATEEQQKEIRELQKSLQ